MSLEEYPATVVAVAELHRLISALLNLLAPIAQSSPRLFDSGILSLMVAGGRRDAPRRQPVEAGRFGPHPSPLQLPARPMLTSPSLATAVGGIGEPAAAGWCSRLAPPRDGILLRRSAAVGGPRTAAWACPGGADSRTAPWGVRVRRQVNVLAPAGRGTGVSTARGRPRLGRPPPPWRRTGCNRGFRRRRAGRQLAVRRRAPPPSNSSASASAPITGRTGTGVRSATIENCTAVALGLPPASRAAPAARATVKMPDRRHVARIVPLQLRRAAVPDDQVFELEAGHRLREGDRDGEGAQRVPFPRVDRQLVVPAPDVRDAAVVRFGERDDVLDIRRRSPSARMSNARQEYGV